MRVRIGLGVLVAGVLVVIAAIGLAGNAGGQSGDSGDLFAQMRGTHEVSTTGDTGAGDRNGRGSFSALITGRRLCFAYTVTGIEKPLQAHIHRGRAGDNGGVVIPLDVPDAGAPGTVSGCATATRTLLSQIRRSPGSFYANVHNEAFPGGAIRGQLFHPSSRQDR